MGNETEGSRNQGLGSRIGGVSQTIRMAAATVGIGVSAGLFTKEVQRILALPWLLQNALYLMLLALVFVLIGSWIWCTLKHLEQMGRWADAIDYYPPEEVLPVFGVASLLIALIYAARDPLAFGAVYVLYAGTNLFTARHLRRETAEVIRKTRAGFVREPQAPSLPVRSEAIAALESYFAKLLSARRAWATLLLAACGLGLAVYGAARRWEPARDLAYVVFLVSVAVPELILSWRWRADLDRRLRPCAARLFELERSSRSA